MIRQPPDEHPPHERVSEEHERARVLADVLRDQAERAQAALEADAREHQRRRMRRGVLATVWIAAAWVWIFNPGFSRVAPPSAPALAEDVRSLRINLFLQAQQVEAFQEARGRLPWVLQETGPPLAGMEYTRLDNQTYELEARSRRVRMAYSSQSPPLDFVGDAARLLTSGEGAGAAFQEQTASSGAGAPAGGGGP